MGASETTTGEGTAATRLVELAMAYTRSCMLCAAARLQVADALGDTERSVDELAAACGADRGALHRLLRALAALGLTREVAPGRFLLTAEGQPLRRDATGSVWASVVFWADLLADSWSRLTDCVRTGQRASDVAKQAGTATRLASDPEAPAIFRAVMGTGASEDYLPIAEAWDFSHVRVVADLGGGGGALLEAILFESHPHLQGMLVDRPEAVEAARARFATPELAGRCRLIAADLREEVPAGADVHLLKHVLHGYDDADAGRVLVQCRKALERGGRLLVIEFVLPEMVSGPDTKLLGRLMSDLNMLAVTGGRERTEAEWSALLGTSGFLLEQTVPVDELNVAVLVARPT